MRRQESETSILEHHLASTNEILKKYQTAGVLFGGVLNELYSQQRKHKPHKDLDILVLSTDCMHHPFFGEGSEGKHIDWWVTHTPNEKPHNDNLQKRIELLFERTNSHEIVDDFIWHHRRREAAALYWSLTLKRSVPNGLYLLSPTIAQETLKYYLNFLESKFNRNKIEKYLKGEWLTQTVASSYPTLDNSQVTVNLLTDSNPTAKYCRLYGQ